VAPAAPSPPRVPLPALRSEGGDAQLYLISGDTKHSQYVTFVARSGSWCTMRPYGSTQQVLSARRTWLLAVLPDGKLAGQPPSWEALQAGVVDGSEDDDDEPAEPLTEEAVAPVALQLEAEELTPEEQPPAEAGAGAQVFVLTGGGAGQGNIGFSGKHATLVRVGASGWCTMRLRDGSGAETAWRRTGLRALLPDGALTAQAPDSAALMASLDAHSNGDVCPPAAQRISAAPQPMQPQRVADADAQVYVLTGGGRVQGKAQHSGARAVLLEKGKSGYCKMRLCDCDVEASWQGSFLRELLPDGALAAEAPSWAAPRQRIAAKSSQLPDVCDSSIAPILVFYDLEAINISLKYQKKDWRITEMAVEALTLTEQGAAQSGLRGRVLPQQTNCTRR
jgi:hypothetical protein